MAKAFARQTKLKNVVGRSQYISDNQRQEHIVLHSQENMIHSWNEYADYEKQNRKNKEENIQKTIKLWEAIAARYNGNEWVAGYDFLNEPGGALGAEQFEV